MSNTNCPACNFEERHLISCPIRVLILAGQKLREELAEVGGDTHTSWGRESLREWDAVVTKSDRVMVRTIDDKR